MTRVTEAETRRVPGRPRRISEAQILAAASTILQSDGLQALTMAAVAKAVGASTMALYTYFPNRSALLEALAEHIFASFDIPSESAGWEATLRTWVAALQHGFERRPAAWRLIHWDDHVAPAWLKVWTPMSHALIAAGLKDKELLFVCRWLNSAVMGAIHGLLGVAPSSSVSALVGRSGLSDSDDALLAELARLYDPAQRQAVFDFEVDIMVRVLGELIDQRGRTDRPQAEGRRRRDMSAAGPSG